MLHVTLDQKNKIALLEPDSALTQSDFENAVKIIDPFLEKKGHLSGLIIHTKSFPGWDSFGALVTHLKFVNAHHKKVSKIAFTTDSIIGDLAQHIGSHFINAEVKHFAYDAMKEAKEWITSN
jgi:hypothetical protein